MRLAATYPTTTHERAAERLVAFLADRPEVDAVLLVGSCARGKGFQDIDFATVVAPGTPERERRRLWSAWETFAADEPTVQAVRDLGDFGRVDMDIIDGAFEPDDRDWTSGPSEFELEVGNYVAYSVPLFDRGGRYAQLRDEWLPYYDDATAQERLLEVRKYCTNNLSHVHTFVQRGIHFQAFHRLYDAFREFVQALFIARRTYPIAYDKWIREQVVDILGLPDLYRTLARIIAIPNIESDAASRNAVILEQLLEEYAPA